MASWEWVRTQLRSNSTRANHSFWTVSAYVNSISSGTLLTPEKKLSHCYLEHLYLVSERAVCSVEYVRKWTLADTNESFAMIRGGHIDVAILGVSLQVR